MPFRRQAIIAFDAGMDRPYIAAHARLFSDHYLAPPPSLGRYGTGALARLKEQKLVPPVPRHGSQIVSPRIRPDRPKGKG
jgi:hypothetical protein